MKQYSISSPILRVCGLSTDKMLAFEEPGWEKTALIVGDGTTRGLKRRTHG
jgi:hypothetical protein